MLSWSSCDGLSGLNKSKEVKLLNTMNILYS